MAVEDECESHNTIMRLVLFNGVVNVVLQQLSEDIFGFHWFAL